MIYFDNAASTKPDKDIIDKYCEINNKYFANPSSLNSFSKECEYLFNKAKSQILNNLHLKNYNIIFTSGASESNSLALIGYVLRNLNKGDHIIVSEVEHASILSAAKFLSETYNVKVSYLKVKNDGQFDIEHFKQLINDKTILVSLMQINNEIGTIYNFDDIKSILKKYPKVILHSDACQGLGKVDCDYNIFDMMTFSAHKIHGLKGCGCLIFKNNIKLYPIIFGGNQQLEIRSGTLDIANAVCFAMAIRKTLNDFKTNYSKIQNIHDEIYDYLKRNPNLYELNSQFDDCPYIINFSLKTKKASVVCEALSIKGIMLTTVSACSSHVDSSSYVVKALNKSKDIYNNTLRISFDKNNTIEDAKKFVNILDVTIKELKDAR